MLTFPALVSDRTKRLRALVSALSNNGQEQGKEEHSKLYTCHPSELCFEADKPPTLSTWYGLCHNEALSLFEKAVSPARIF
jgi:hypothetical protein